MMNRYATRRQQLSETFLNEKLKNAKTYDRIAGYFSSSLLEVAGGTIEKIDKIRISKNSAHSSVVSYNSSAVLSFSPSHSLTDTVHYSPFTLYPILFSPVLSR